MPDFRQLILCECVVEDIVNQCFRGSSTPSWVLIVGQKDDACIASIKSEVSLSELQFRMLMLQSPISIISFFSVANFSSSGFIKLLVNSLTHTLGCLQMQPIILFFDFASIISINVDSVSFDLHILRSFLTLYLILLSIQIKVPPFEDSAVVYSKV